MPEAITKGSLVRYVGKNAEKYGCLYMVLVETKMKDPYTEKWMDAFNYSYVKVENGLLEIQPQENYTREKRDFLAVFELYDPKKGTD